MKTYESYPLWMVFVTVLSTLLVILAAGYIMFTLHWITGVLYIIYVILIEYSIYKEGCVNCYYFGKRCAFGRGVIAGLLFKKGDPKKFESKEIKWKDLMPQMLGVLVPSLVGVALLISRGFDLLILIALLYPILSWFAINPLVYGKIACAHCKQGEKCCPALEFFKKK